jgi:hypothetical protein
MVTLACRHCQAESPVERNDHISMAGHPVDYRPGPGQLRPAGPVVAAAQKQVNGRDRLAHGGNAATTTGLAEQQHARSAPAGALGPVDRAARRLLSRAPRPC